MTVKVRFAPSPTGMLHVGNARTALINWLYARKHDGVFLLRIDDTDPERSKPEFEESIREDIQWLGLTHDEEFRQSDRDALYEAAVEKLKAAGRLYPCYETPEELGLKRKTQLARGVPPLYDRGALKLTDEEKQKFETEGRKPHWRLLLEDKKVEWEDLARGHVEFQGGHLSDPVLIREDGRPIYTLSSVVDDIESKVTHIIRGEDHVANTAVQVQLIEALGEDPKQFTFAHLNLLTGATGENLSKRLGSLSLRSLRVEEGVEAMTVASFLAKLGTSDAINPYLDMQSLVNDFDISHFSRSSPKFSEVELMNLNEKMMHALSFDHVKDKVHGIDEGFWKLIQENITKVSDVHKWVEICEGKVAPVIADQDFIDTARELLPPEPWDEGTFKTWTSLIKEKTGRKGKELFMPLRLALTGLEHGPSLGGLLLKIGYEKAFARLSGDTA